MKTKTFLLLCLLTGIGFTQLIAQNGNEVVRDLNPEYEYRIPVFSPDGEQIDMLVGDMAVHGVYHFQNGIWIWAVSSWYGEVESVGNGEVFSIRDQFKNNLTDYSNIGSGHFNARGDQGSHYIIFYDYYYDFESNVEEITFVKAISPGSKK